MMLQPTKPAWFRYGVALAAVGGALIIRFLLGYWLGDRAPFQLFTLAVLVTALVVGRGPALVALVLGSALGVVFFIDPVGSVAVTDSSQFVRVALNLAIGLIAIALVHYAKIAQWNESAARQAASDSEELFSQLADSIPQLAWMARPDGYIYWYNRRWHEYTGTNPQTMKGWQWQSVHDPAVLPEVMERYKQSLASGEPFDMEFPLRGADGRFRTFLTRTMPFRDASGNITRWFGTNTDIEDRRLAAEALKASEQRFRVLGDSAPVLIWQTDANGRYVWFNKPWLSFTGRATEEELGDGWLQSVHPDDRARCIASFQEAFENRTPFELECRLRRNDGEFRSILNRGIPMYGREGEFLGYMGGCLDITDRVNAERQREVLLQAERAAREQAERINRMKDEFLATVSHELRTPLTAILGWTHILKTGKRSEKEMQDALSVIDRNSRAQARLVEDLLDMSRIMSGKIRLNTQRLNLRDVLEAAIDSSRVSAEARQISLSLQDQSDGSAVVVGDATRLQQVAWNLLSNAIKFTPPGGAVIIRIEADAFTASVHVSDTGQGIDAAFLPHVFDRFSQADSSSTRQHGGLGLGLSIVRQLLEVHGGTISVASEGPGRGSTFTIRLPRAGIVAPAVPGSNVRPQPLAPLGAVVSLAGCGVLVVEDENDTREFLSNLLSRHGAQVESADSAAEAERIMRTFKPDVIVSDIGMPEVDGYRFMREMRARASRVPAIALTAFAREEDRAAAVDAGYDAHMAKPPEPDQFIALVASLAARPDGTPAKQLLQ